jgi:glycosyltransferase involved in cell wall biosynthesis
VALGAQIASPGEAGVGLAERLTVESLARLDPGRSYLVYGRRDLADWAARFPNLAYRPSRLAGLCRPTRIVWENFLLPRRLERDRAELYHGLGYLVPAGLRIPSVVTVYDTIALDRPDLARRSNVAYYRRALVRSLRTAVAVVVPTEATRSSVLRHAPESAGRVRVMAPGPGEPAPPGDPEARRRAIVGFELVGRTVLFVGTIEPKKNVPGLLRAFAILKDRFPEAVTLVLAGREGWDRGRARRTAAELGLGASVRFTGYVEREALEDLYAAADVLALPSFVEGFGFPVLESQARAVPVVAADVPALTETAGDGALFADPSAPGVLADAIARVLADEPFAGDLIERGRANVKRYSWSGYAAKLAGLHAEILRSG